MPRIFTNDWVFACAADEIPAPGDYYVFRLDGEPVMVLRGGDGVVRAFSNICRHRGTQLLDDGFGRIEKHIVCPYHAWSYDGEGVLQAVPFAKEVAVDRKAHALVACTLTHWRGLLFMHLGQPDTPLESRIEGIDRYLSVFENGRFNKVFSGPIEVWDSNWKLILENAMESYHLFKVHSQTLEFITPTRGAWRFRSVACRRHEQHG